MTVTVNNSFHEEPYTSTSQISFKLATFMWEFFVKHPSQSTVIVWQSSASVHRFIIDSVEFYLLVMSYHVSCRLLTKHRQIRITYVVMVCYYGKLLQHLALQCEFLFPVFVSVFLSHFHQQKRSDWSRGKSKCPHWLLRNGTGKNKGILFLSPLTQFNKSLSLTINYCLIEGCVCFL